MSPFQEVEASEELQFKWVKKRGRGGKNKEFQFYESFVYDDVAYSLYDCVFMHKQGETAPYIGKIIKIWETPDKSKKVKVHWFFRPSEISYYLKGMEVLENELFLASGSAKDHGLANINPLEAIAGKCHVLCTSTDSRNPQPSPKELQTADYLFYRTFHVKSCEISDQIGDVGELPVEFVFNRKSIMTHEIHTLGSSQKGNACDETLNPFCQNLSEELETVSPDRNLNNLVERANIDVENKKIKPENFSGNNINKPLHMDAREDKEAFNKNDNDEMEDVKPPTSMDQVGKKVKFPRKSIDLDDRSPKRVKLYDSLEEPRTNDVNRGQSFLTPSNEKEPIKKSLSSLDCAPNSPQDGKSRGSQMNVNVASSNHVDVASSILGDLKNSRVDKEKEKVLSKDVNLCKDEPSKASVLHPSVSRHEKNPLENGKDSKGTETLVDPKKSAGANIASSEEKMKSTHDESCGVEHDKKMVQASNRLEKKPSNLSSMTFNEKGKLKYDQDNDKDLVGVRKNVKEYDGYDPSDRRPSKTLKVDVSFGDKKRNTTPKLQDKSSKMGAKAMVTSSVDKNQPKIKSPSGPNNGPLKENTKEKTSKGFNGNLPKSHSMTSTSKDLKMEGQFFDVTPRPILDKSKWLREPPWEEKMRNAYDQGTLVLLQNLDPEYTSEEVEDIIWHAFKESCTAKMLQHTAVSSPHIGQAFAIFKNKDAAERVLKKLHDGCLMLPNQRMLVGCAGAVPRLPQKQTTFVGHLDVKRQLLKERDSKDAVSTSHYTQNNTVEHEMAVDWFLLQARSEKWFDILYKRHEKELKQLTADLKLKRALIPK